MPKLVFEITDGYHDPDFYFDDGTVLIGRDEFIKFLCAPHSDTFIFRSIYYEDFDEGSDEEQFLEKFLQYNSIDRVINFHSLVKFYHENYT